MSVIHVRSVPNELAARLHARAKAHHRSMEAEVCAILSEAVQGQPPTRSARHVNFDLIAKMNLGELPLAPLRPAFAESTQFD